MRSSAASERRSNAGAYARELERDAVGYPDERGEILLEAAGQYAMAGEHQRAMDILEDLIATASGEDAQFAAVSRIDVLYDLGREWEIEEELARLRRSGIAPGPASLVAEYLERHDRLREALDWYDLACREHFALEAQDSMPPLELLGRARVRKVLGLPPDAFDEQIGQQRADLLDRLDRLPSRAERPLRAAGFFVRDDVERAFAEGLVHVDDSADRGVESYFRRCERAWRTATTEAGTAGQQVLPTTVEDLLAYAAERGQDPADEGTRADHLRQRIGEGAHTITWPPERNAPCWCGSARKYKKCCGSPSNR